MVLFTSIILHANEVVIVLSEDQSIHKEIAQNIEQSTNLISSTVLFSDFVRDESTKTHSAIVAIGTRACDKSIAIASSADVVFCSLIPSQTFKALRVKYNKTDSENITAIFMDQPISRQMALARLISPNAETIGTVFGRISIAQRESFETEGQNANFITHYAFIDDDENPVQILTPLIQRSDIFLAISDNANFNRSISRWALYITLRNKIPLIGFSKNYSDAGAVVSIYSTPAQLAEQTYNALKLYFSTGNVIQPAYPDDFTVDINRSTARTLRLSLPDEATLHQQLKEISP